MSYPHTSFAPLSVLPSIFLENETKHSQESYGPLSFAHERSPPEVEAAQELNEGFCMLGRQQDQESCKRKRTRGGRSVLGLGSWKGSICVHRATANNRQ